MPKQRQDRKFFSKIRNSMEDSQSLVEQRSQTISSLDKSRDMSAMYISQESTLINPLRHFDNPYDQGKRLISNASTLRKSRFLPSLKSSQELPCIQSIMATI